MKRRLIHTVGIIVSAMFVFAASPAAGQTTANGPYYATPSWDQKLDCTALNSCPRFIVLSNWASAAVLDRETGLVWEKSPAATQLNWSIAQVICVRKNVGGRGGWKLPSVQDLRSLVDPTQSNPALPAGHPFFGVQSDFYWSGTTFEADPTLAWFVNVGNGFPDSDVKSSTNSVWCVRGGSGGDAR